MSCFPQITERDDLPSSRESREEQLLVGRDRHRHGTVLFHPNKWGIKKKR